MSGKPRPEVLFHSMLGGTQIFLKEDGLSYVMVSKQPKDNRGTNKPSGMSDFNTYCRVDLDFIGAGKPAIETSNPTDGLLNFFLPSCPDGASGIKAYNTVTYKNMYPNIDVVYAGTISKGLKYNIVVNAGGNASDIKMQYTGAGKIDLTEDGRLDIYTTAGKMNQYIPSIYQDINGTKVAVNGNYTMLENKNGKVTVGFKIGKYNLHYPLIIDPWWSTYIGGSYQDYAYGCCFDNSNNVLVTGSTSDIDFPSTAGAFQVANAGPKNTTEVFVIKFTPAGNRIWATYYGGTGGDYGYGIAVDASNNVVFTGATSSSNFPVSAGCFQNTYNGSSGCLFCNASNAFLVKLDPTGATRLWGTYYGGNDWTVANGLAIDPSGNIAIGGTTTSKTLPVSAGCFQNNPGSANPGYEDAFAADFNSAGSFLWGTYVGGSVYDWGDGVAVDNAGDVYLTGSTQSTDYPTSAGAFQTTYGGGTGWGDAFVIKFNNGGTMQWSTYLGGAGDDGGHGIGVDGNNDIVVTGLTLSTNFPVTAGAYQTTNINVIKYKLRDDFLTKFNPTGGVLWSTYSNVNTENGAQSLTIDEHNNIYVTDDIEYSGPDTPAVITPPITGCAFDKRFDTNNVTIVDVTEGEDNYITKYATTGFPICETYLGGSGADEHEFYSKNIAVQNCRMAVCGATSGAFIISNGAFISKNPQGADSGTAFTGYVTDMNAFACGDTAIPLTFTDTIKSISCSKSAASFYSHVCDSTDTAGIVYSWVFTGGNPSTGTGQNVSGVTYTSSGTYPVTLNLVACGTTIATTTDNITISISFSSSVTPTNAVTCGGTGSATAVASGGSPPYTYSWSNGNTSATDNNLSVGTYTCIVNSAANCPDTIVFSITGPATPTVTVAPPKDTICSGGNVTLNASGATTYTWSPATGLNATTGASVTANPTTNTTYTVVGITSGCTDSAKTVITVTPGLPITITPPSGTICSGASVGLTASGSSTYTWSPATGLNSTTGASVTAKPAATTTYTITGKSASGCTRDTAVTITVNPLPIVILSGTTSICQGNSTVITASGGGTYSWSNGSTSATINVTPAATTTYSVTVTNGPCSKDTSITVTVAPTPTISNTQEICKGAPVTLTATGGGTYAWSTGATTNSITLSPATSGTYSVTITNGPCIATDSAKVIVDPAPAATACCNVTINIGNDTILSISPVSKGDSYSWTPAYGLSCTNCPNPAASPTVTTWYYATITDSNGCNKKDSILITVTEDCGHIFVPNAFSPNGDNENDVLYVYGGCIESIDFVIYDRWGNKVFETEDIKTGWDGTFKGSPMNTGVFVYYMKALLLNKNVVTQKGNITLVR